MDPAFLEQVRTLTLHGKTQREQRAILHCSRDRIFRAQKRLGLSLPKRGPRIPILTAEQQQEAFALLIGGVGTMRIAKALNVSVHRVRTFAESHGFTRRADCVQRLDPESREKFLAEIRGRTNFASDLASKYDLNYACVKRYAHAILGVPRFRPGHLVEPLSSDFPIKEQPAQYGQTAKHMG